MEEEEKRMKAKIITDSFFIGQYQIANKYIKDLNKEGFNELRAQAGGET